ncbi:MAG: fasciclin domain-containing protein [Planctomycetes bacterium]|nr:fasciclin domain-containing protein [Planctomycetota bacterium]
MAPLRTLPLLAAMAAFGLAGCSDNDSNAGPSAATPTITGSLQGLGLNTLAAALQAAGLDDDLAGTAQLTLFAPSDAAFAALPPGTVDSLLQPANRQQLIDILRYHVVAGAVPSTTARTLTGATTLGGAAIAIDAIGTDLFVNDGKVTTADVAASNGFVHVVDTVLLPPQSVVATLQARGFSTLVAAVQAAGLAATLSGPGPFTVLAPTDAAFAALPPGTLDSLLLPANQADLARLLTYHVLPSRTNAGAALAAELRSSVQGASVLFAAVSGVARVNGTRLRSFNIPCTNGVVHVLDAVLSVPATIAATAQQLGFSTLVAALNAAGLTATFADAAAGPFTVLAPTDAAFAALPAGLLQQLLQPVNLPVLTQILQFHVLPTPQTARSITARAGQGLPTLLGPAVPVTTGQNGLLLDGQAVLTTDVLAANGLVHAIGGVLVPPGVLAQLQ